MKITVGRIFEIDTRHGLYVRVIGVGAAHRGQFGWTFDRWSTLRRLGEV